MSDDRFGPIHELRKELADAIVEYNRHIPTAEGEWLEDLLWHKDLNLRILAHLATLPHA